MQQPPQKRTKLAFAFWLMEQTGGAELLGAFKRRLPHLGFPPDVNDEMSEEEYAAFLKQMERESPAYKELLLKQKRPPGWVQWGRN